MRNWAGNVEFIAEDIATPRSLGEAQQVIADAAAVRVFGTGHSFNRIADGRTILDSSGLPEFLELNAERTAVRVNGSMTYGRLVELLAPLGLAVHNLASLPHISIAGAIATGTHGSGDRNGNLATAVSAVQVITGTGEVVDFERGRIDFEGAVVSLGALGLVSSVTLDVEPAFAVEQRVFDGPTIERLAGEFDAVFSAAYSVSAFTRWRSDVEQIWVKRRVDEPAMAPGAAAFFASLPAADRARHPILELDATACTEQLGVQGSWADRLPHFRMDFTPSAGEEIQSEFFVDRQHATGALEAVAAVGGQIADALLISEIRTIASDGLWMSPHVRRDSVGLHFTWAPDQPAAERAARVVVDALRSFAPRAHWGKVFDPAQFDLDAYPDRRRFIELVERLDPQGTFVNQWFADVFSSR